MLPPSLGLSEAQVLENRLRFGFNELPTNHSLGLFPLLLRTLSEPMLLMLLGAGIVYLFMGEPSDAYFMLLTIVLVIGTTVWQERKTEKTLAKLRDLASPRAKVIRDNHRLIIPGREVVPEDIVILEEGDRIPADGVVLSAANLVVDESLLTGESVSVTKFAKDPVYSGCLIVAGHAMAQIKHIGISTQIGQIGHLVKSHPSESTLLRRETRRLVRYISVIGLLACLIVFLLHGLIYHSWLAGLLSGLTLAMAILPEEIPVVLTVFLTLGAWRLSKKHVLTRRSDTIETLGAATVLCVDKTGTLTHNRMQLSALYAQNSLFNLSSSTPPPESFHSLLEYAYLASQAKPFDPIEKEIHSAAQQLLTDSGHFHPDWQETREYQITSQLTALSHVWLSAKKNSYIIAAKGAPEAIFDLCHLSSTQKARLQKQISTLANQGLRVLGVASATWNRPALPDDQHEFKFHFEGLLGFIDPVRTTATDAVAECYQAGIRVIMITGDYPGTASFVAREIGLSNPDTVITGSQLDSLSLSQLSDTVRSVNVFARIRPEQKLKIVEALKHNHEIVAMTGDGVNDTPALKAAHIGIAMGEHGTDVARESAALVLLNDDFSSIVAAVRSGRRIFTNLRSAMKYLLSVHIPITGFSLLPLFLGYPPLLLPAHIAFMELIIDPTCSTLFEAEPEHADIMRLPPRPLNQHLISKNLLRTSLFQGFFVFFLLSALYLYLHPLLPENTLRAILFSALVIANISLIFINISASRSNKSLWLVISLALLGLLLTLSVPFLRTVFSF